MKRISFIIGYIALFLLIVSIITSRKNVKTNETARKTERREPSGTFAALNRLGIFVVDGSIIPFFPVTNETS